MNMRAVDDFDLEFLEALIELGYGDEPEPPQSMLPYIVPFRPQQVRTAAEPVPSPPESDALQRKTRNDAALVSRDHGCSPPSLFRTCSRRTGYSKSPLSFFDYPSRSARPAALATVCSSPATRYSSMSVRGTLAAVSKLFVLATSRLAVPKSRCLNFRSYFRFELRILN